MNAHSPTDPRYATDGPYANLRLWVSLLAATMLAAGMWSIVVVMPKVQADLQKIPSLRQQNPNLKVLLSVGGWGARGFSGAAAATSTRLMATGTTAARR